MNEPIENSCCILTAYRRDLVKRIAQIDGALKALGNGVAPTDNGKVRRAGRKLTEAKVRTIKRRLKKGWLPTDLAEHYDVTVGAIRNIDNGVAWSDVKP